MKPKSIILLSGGLDSTVSAAIALKKTRPLFALTIDYGQRAAEMEILASQKICRALGIKHKMVRLPFFREFKKCRLITGDQSFKKHPSLYSLPLKEGRGYLDFLRLKDVWVPNRNALFINIAACFAEYYKAELIVTGFNREEAREFPDNTKEFIDAINKTLQFSTLRKIKVVSYVANYTKREIYQIGISINAPLEFIYSCYLGGKKMCGKCASCLKLQNVIQKYHNLSI